MREIKFRAWNDFKKQMKYDVYKEYRNLMQYTGLKDKNGKEIYEGDIVKGINYGFNNPQRFIGEVKYVYNRYEVKGVKQYKGMRDELNTIYEVIGNIYEDKHLLEVHS